MFHSSKTHALNLISMKMLLDINCQVGDGREVLTSAVRLKYYHKASHLPTTCTC